VPQTLSNNGARVIGLTTNDTSSIEIVRGPNSALYGRTAIGGSVNMRTADPTTKQHPDHRLHRRRDGIHQGPRRRQVAVRLGGY